MKTFRYILVVVAALVVIVLAAGSFQMARAATPNVIPQGQMDTGLTALNVLKTLHEVLIQKMNADIEATNRLAAAQERANELKAAEINRHTAIICFDARETRRLEVWEAFDCYNLIGIPMPEEMLVQ